MTDRSPTPRRGARSILSFLLIGLVAGFLSGMFGVGGGVLIVPALLLILHMPQKVASNTSLAAIVPLSIVGILSYALQGNLDPTAWVPGIILGVGGALGSVVGSRLLPRAPVPILQLGFAGVLVVAIVSLLIVIPPRGEPFPLDVVSIIGLAVVGLIVGVLSKLLGVGGGVLIVPALLLLFGVSDLLARVVSLIAMIPTAIVGTIDSVRSRQGDFVAAGLIAAAACTTPPLGAWVAQSVDPHVGNILFALLLATIVVQLVLRAWRARGHR